jgi:hypothetical protein
LIQVRSIYLFRCDSTTPPKPKFCICVQVDPRPFFLLINSEINPYIEARSQLRAQQIAIAQADHTFLDHDSWIDCTEVHPVDNAANQLAGHAGCLRGVIAAATCAQVVEAVTASRTLPKARKDIILAGLT